MACGCGTYSVTTTHPCNITAEVCHGRYIDITPFGTALQIVTPPVNGTATILPNGNIRYDHAGLNFNGDPFVYQFASGNGTGTCTVGIKVLEGIPENTKVIILTASGECEVGNPTFEWDLPECAQLYPGYTINDNPIKLIMPGYDPQNPVSCEVKVNMCCDYCNNCCRCENYVWTPPVCIYECGEDPVCSCEEPCTAYNPVTGNCESCPSGTKCCSYGTSSYLCRECCDNIDCPANQQCVGGQCGCPPGTIENGLGACCPTILPNCAICDAQGNVVDNVDIVCDPATQQLNQSTCQCECLPGLCLDQVTNQCVECPACVLQAGRFKEKNFGEGYSNYSPTCTACQQCIACNDCPGGYQCTQTPCAPKSMCQGQQVDNVVNPLPTTSYVDQCTKQTVTCSEEQPCCCKKVVPPKDKKYICQDGVCHEVSDCPEPPIPGSPCFNTASECTAMCGEDPDPDEYFRCVNNVCTSVTSCPPNTTCYSTLLECQASECEKVEQQTIYYCQDNQCVQTEVCPPNTTCYNTLAACGNSSCGVIPPPCPFPPCEEFCSNSLIGSIVCEEDNQGCFGIYTAINSAGAVYRVRKRNSQQDAWQTCLTDQPINTDYEVITISLCDGSCAIPVGGQIIIDVTANPEGCPDISRSNTRSDCANITCEVDAAVTYSCNSGNATFVITNGVDATYQIFKKLTPSSDYIAATIPVNITSLAPNPLVLTYSTTTSPLMAIPVGGSLKIIVNKPGCNIVEAEITRPPCEVAPPGCQAELTSNFVCNNSATFNVTNGSGYTATLYKRNSTLSAWNLVQTFGVINTNSLWTQAINTVAGNTNIPVGGQLRLVVQKQTCQTLEAIVTKEPCGVECDEAINIEFICPGVVFLNVLNAVGATLLLYKRPTQLASYTIVGNPITITTNPQLLQLDTTTEPYLIPVGGQIKAILNSGNGCPNIIVELSKPSCPSLSNIVPCCIEGNCSQITVSQCLEQNGIIWPSPAICAENCQITAPVPVWCCENGNCLEVQNIEECQAGIPYAIQSDCNTNCTPNPPVLTGACCISGQCYVGYTETNCLSSNGIYAGIGTVCNPTICESICDDVITTGTITEGGTPPPSAERYIYIPAWINGNSI